MEDHKASRVLEDILQLERDFKYNLNLLKIRDIEIQKCKNMNETLQNNISRIVEENKILNLKNMELQHEHAALKREREQEKEIYDRSVKKLQIEQICRNEANISKVVEIKHQQKEDLMKVISELKVTEQTYKEKLTECEADIMHRTETYNNIQKKYNDLMDENIRLSNKVKELNARHLSEICMYKSELEKSTNLIYTLKRELQGLQSDYKAYLNTQNKLVKENNDLRIKLIQCDKMYNECVEDNLKLKDEVAASRLKFDRLQESHNSLVKEMDILKSNSNISLQHDPLLQQNKIMQEIIKSLRKNRVKDNGDATEEKLLNLEISVQQLKQIMLKDSQ